MNTARPGDAYLIERLTKEHHRSAFSCGKPPLDRYLREQASQDAKRFIAATFVALPRTEVRVAGYYSLSSTSVDAGELPPEMVKRLPRYPKLPATLLARLAVDVGHKGRGLGEFLLMHALSRSLTQTQEVASLAVVVDAIDEEARAFYEKYEFIPFREQPLRLYLPMQSIVRKLQP